MGSRAMAMAAKAKPKKPEKAKKTEAELARDSRSVVNARQARST